MQDRIKQNSILTKNRLSCSVTQDVNIEAITITLPTSMPVSKTKCSSKSAATIQSLPSVKPVRKKLVRNASKKTYWIA